MHPVRYRDDRLAESGFREGLVFLKTAKNYLRKQVKFLVIAGDYEEMLSFKASVSLNSHLTLKQWD
jgi:hypothetical protein